MYSFFLFRLKVHYIVLHKSYNRFSKLSLLGRMASLIHAKENMNTQAGIDIRKEPPIESRTIEEFVSYEAFLRKQFPRIPETEMGPISGSHLPYEYVYNGASPFNEFEYSIKKYFWGADDIVYRALRSGNYHQLSEIMSYTSIASVFKDTETITFLPVYLYFNTGVAVALKYLVDGEEYAEGMFNTKKFSHELFQGKYDHHIQISKFDNEQQRRTNRSLRDANSRKLGVFTYMLPIETGFSTIFKMFDKHLYRKTIPYILEECKKGKTICSLTNIHGLHELTNFGMDHKICDDILV